MYFILKIIHTFSNSKELDRTVSKFGFPFQLFAIYASTKWCTLEYFIAHSRSLIQVRNKWGPEIEPLSTPYILVRSELKPFIEVYCFSMVYIMEEKLTTMAFNTHKH